MNEKTSFYYYYLHKSTHTHTHRHRDQSRALEVFFHLFNNKKWSVCIFYQINNLFLTPVLFKKPTPSQLKLIKKAKNHILLLKKFKNTSKCPALTETHTHTHKKPPPPNRPLCAEIAVKKNKKQNKRQKIWYLSRAELFPSLKTTLPPSARISRLRFRLRLKMEIIFNS